MDLHKAIRDQLKRALGSPRSSRTNVAASVNIGKNGASTSVTTTDEVTIINRDGEVTVIRHDGEQA